MLRVAGRALVFTAVLALVSSAAYANPHRADGVRARGAHAPADPFTDDIGPYGPGVRAAVTETFNGPYSTTIVNGSAAYPDGEISKSGGSTATDWSGHDGSGAGSFPTNPTGFVLQSLVGSPSSSGRRSVFFDEVRIVGDQNQLCAAGQQPRVRTPANLDTSLLTNGTDMYINDIGGGIYEWVPQSQSAALVFTRVLFDYAGYVYVLDRDNTDAAIFAPTGVANTYGSWFTLQIVSDGHHFDVLLGPDKDHLVNIYHSTGGASGTALPFAPTVEQEVLLTDVCQQYGIPANVDLPVGAFWDNLQVKPEPGTLAMLGAGALLAIRRRRSR